MGDVEAKVDVLAVANGVWISGLVYGGPAEELIKLGMTGRVRLVTGAEQVMRLETALKGSFGFSEGACREVRRLIADCAEIVSEPASPAGQNGHAIAAGPGIHPRDVLELAVRIGASAIAVTADSDVGRLESHQGIPIFVIA